MSNQFVMTTTLTVAIIVLLTFPIRNINSSAVLIADFSMSRMIELSSRTPFCKMHHDRGDIQRMLLSADPRRVRQVPRDSVMALESVCHDTSVGGVGNDFQGGLGFIYPGTKWCGPGNLASEFSDLGRYAAEDKCCREHDLCPNTLSPNECRRGLCNTGTFTRSHCDCDARFRRCLQSVNTETANTLGAVFFNVVQVTCFRERNPCTVFQRLAGFDDNIPEDLPCRIAFERAKFYLPQKTDFLGKILNLTNFNELNDDQSSSLSSEFLHSSNTIERSLHNGENMNFVDEHEEYHPSTFDSFTSKIGIKLASLGLVVSSLFREMVNINVNDITNFFTKTRPNSYDKSNYYYDNNFQFSG